MRVHGGEGGGRWKERLQEWLRRKAESRLVREREGGGGGGGGGGSDGAERDSVARAGMGLAQRGQAAVAEELGDGVARQEDVGRGRRGLGHGAR